ncbi:hypothetical protein JDFR1000234_30 [uncultured archaeal virus]|jgi:hypothetical protein|uniref:Uncharacterized protein n=1 Tax=uncultured archaeal virus TaxID=1960247 RepID=A0A1S5Y306_9VIRU|nr:hypothetical protein JDFR1000234_30 [uncultured archaeal virus]
MKEVLEYLKTILKMEVLLDFLERQIERLEQKQKDFSILDCEKRRVW